MYTYNTYAMYRYIHTLHIAYVIYSIRQHNMDLSAESPGKRPGCTDITDGIGTPDPNPINLVHRCV